MRRLRKYLVGLSCILGAFFIVCSSKKSPCLVYAEDAVLVPTASPAADGETPDVVTGGAVATVKPPAPDLVPVTGISAQKGSGLVSASVAWKAYPNAIRYEILGKILSAKEYTLFGTSNIASFQAIKLKAGLTYRFIVLAVVLDGNGTEYRTPPSSAVQIGLKPAKVKSFKAVRMSGKILLKWSRVKNVSGYQLQRKVHIRLRGFKAKFSHLKNIKGTKKNSLKNVMLVRGMKYSYRIRTFKKIGGKKVYSNWKTIYKKKCR